jgi:phage terminase large subunit
MATWEDVDNSDPTAWKPQARCCWCGGPLVLSTILESSAWTCTSLPCVTRQVKYAMTAQVPAHKGHPAQNTLQFLPLPRQTECLEAVHSQGFRRILYGGAAGGGKSHLLRYLAYQLGLKYKNFNILLLRRTWPELEETHIREAQREVGPNPGQIPGKCTPSNRLVEFHTTGSILKFGHCQDEKDMTEYLSREYDLILFDELVTFTETQYLLISSRARNKRTDWAPMVVAGTNPGGPGAAWVTELFINKDRDLKKYPNYKPDQHHYIKALLDDNPYVNESYVEFLMDLPPDMRDAYRWGRWDIFPGQYFKEFRRERHCHNLGLVPPEIPRLGGMDWGYLRAGVFLWAVPLVDGRLYIEREYVFTETPPSEVARNIRLLTSVFGWTLQSAYGDPAMGIRNAESGEDIFETLQKNGLYVTPAKHERVNGWTRMREWLKPVADPKDPLNKAKWYPSLIINPEGCPYLARTIPQMMQDPSKLEDIETKSEDHACDALRYLLMSRPAPVLPSTQKVCPPGTAGALMQELIRASTAQLLGAHNVA